MKELKEIKDLNEFRDWFDQEFEKTIEGDRRTKEFKKKRFQMLLKKQEEWQTLNDQRLREALHEKQYITDCDIASIKLIQENGSSIEFSVGEDGSARFAVLTNKKEIPSYYHYTGVRLKGKYKVMFYDCYNRFEQDGVIIEGDSIHVYRAGKSYIFNIYR